jgi:outer membrane protein
MQLQPMRNLTIMKRICYLFALLFLSSTARSQDTITVEQAIATALQNNYDIRIARNDSIIAAVNFAYRDFALLPNVNGTGTLLFNNNSQSQTYSGDIVKSRNGIQSNNFNYGINANWVLFNGFRMFINRSRIAQLLELGSVTAKSQVVNTISDVIKTYYDIVRQKQQLRNIEEQLRLLTDQLKLAQYKFELGTGIKPDVLQAQIDLNSQQASRITQLATIDQRKQSLALLMNVNQSINFEVSDTIPIDTDLLLNDLLTNLSQTSYQLQISKRNIELAQNAVALARTGLFPTVAFTAAYNFARTNNSSVVNPTVQPLLSTNHGFNYGLTASIPIFNGFAVRQQIKLAKVNVDYEQLLYDRQQAVVTDSVLNVYRTYDAQRKILSLTDSSIAWARENLNIVRERYRLGVTNFIELRQAEQNLEQALTTLINARYNLKVAQTELLRLKGDLIRRQ